MPMGQVATALSVDAGHGDDDGEGAGRSRASPSYEPYSGVRLTRRRRETRRPRCCAVTGSSNCFSCR